MTAPTTSQKFTGKHKIFLPPGRLDVRKVKCPECGAEPGTRCWRNRIGKSRYRGSSNHQQRVNAYRISLLSVKDQIRKSING